MTHHIGAPPPPTGAAWKNPPVPSSLAPLLAPEGRALLERLAEREAELAADPLAAGEALRREGVEPALAAAALAQLDLRRRGRAKFGDDADSMLFTRDGLEQATRAIVSRRRAERFLAAGTTRIADLGCGIGSDSIALARAGLGVLAVDLDEDAATAASENLSSYPRARVERANALDLDIAALAADGVDALFADPARRTGSSKGGRRVLDPESWSPPLSTVLGWRQTIPAVGVKVAPGIAHADLPADARVEWTSVDGDLLEAAIWTGPLALEGPGRSAVVVRDDAIEVLSEDGPANAPVRTAATGPIGAFLAEPDDAVIRSGLVALLAERHDARLVDARIAYLTADAAAPSPFLAWFGVESVVALKPKAIAAELRRLGVGRVEVKKRGADIDPAALRAALKLDPAAEGAAVVLATRIDGRHRAVIARRRASINGVPGHASAVRRRLSSAPGQPSGRVSGR